MEKLGLLILLLIIGAVGYFVIKSSKKEKAEANVVLDQGFPFPCVLEGSIDMPEMPLVIKAARIDVEAAKDYLTSRKQYRPDLSDDECMALCSMPVKGHPDWDGVNEFGGGGPYGGRYLTGAYHIALDTVGQVIDKESWITFFDPTRHLITGGMFPDGKLGMGCIGTSITGQLVSGVLVEGRVSHGDKMVWIFGRMNGTYKRTGA